MHTPLVSIIIPTYNRAHLIGETLDSVLAQTYTNWECIVVDDGSTDGTDKLLAEYCNNDARFQFHHRPNDRLKGANACRNFGFELSKGEYVNWFDSDDMMMPDKLTIQVNELHNSSYDYTICQTMMFDVAKNKEIGLRSPTLYSDNIFEDYILFNIFWLTGAPLWKKIFITQHSLSFDETLQQGQDYDFHMRVLAISENYVPIEKVYVLFNHHTENMSISTSDSVDKLYSNAKVKINLITKYKCKLSYNTNYKNYRELLSLLKTSLRKHMYKNTFFIYIALFFNLKIIKLNFWKKIFFLIKVTFCLILFTLFSKGDRFLKFNI